jgi:hypothetical protein
LKKANRSKDWDAKPLAYIPEETGTRQQGCQAMAVFRLDQRVRNFFPQVRSETGFTLHPFHHHPATDALSQLYFNDIIFLK